MKINMQKHDEVQSSMLIKDIERMIKSNHKTKQVQERSVKIKSHVKKIHYKEKEIKRLGEIEQLLVNRLQSTLKQE